MRGGEGVGGLDGEIVLSLSKRKKVKISLQKLAKINKLFEK